MLAVTTFPPVSGVDSDNYYNKTEVALLIASGGAGGTIDLSNYYKKLETYSKAQVDALVSSGTVDLSDYYTKAQVESLIANNDVDLSNYYNKAEVDGKENEIYAELAFKIGEVDTKLGAKVDKVANSSLVADSKVISYDSHIASASNPHNTTASQVGAYSKTEVDNLLANIDVSGVSLDNYYSKTQTETLLSNKVDKEVGKDLSTNDFTDAFKQALELNKVQNITTDSVTKKLVVAYTDGTFIDLNLDDVVTNVKIESAVLDDTTNVLTILSSDGSADVTVDLSVFVTNQTLSNALVGKVDKVAGKGLSDTNFTQAEKDKLSSLESSKFVGLFVNESTLPSSGRAGDYANVDGGAGSDVYRVIWDTSDAKWVRVKGVSTELTDAQIKQKYESNPDTNAFTDDEKTKLDGVALGATKNRPDIENADKVHIHSPAEVGLGNVNNTSDEDKPISRAQGAAMMAKFNLRDVAQQTGSDGSKVMSQKASTEAFYRAGPGVQKAGKIYVQSTEPTENVEEGDIWLKI